MKERKLTVKHGDGKLEAVIDDYGLAINTTCLRKEYGLEYGSEEETSWWVGITDLQIDRLIAFLKSAKKK
jgi:hypothetical protein